ncbi:prolyl aminopeptidase [Pseudogemmobacter faecipullorum]|uniref:Proline iminopeptidase n=1 Tax=Pseudogemmobacter faecipullorum TaxID=2755041 RepID=A0ABS8CJP1_9RHOB|nr:prolyl aminopeptidase [Pseudogemmobacter faecipullorum]MCB5409614.1 prolyl aminopeptidase [Pseudogemmobacter faecipullorum]
MDQRSGQKRAVDYLYPLVEPFDQRMIDMGDGHQIYVEQCGRPDGVPVILFHGGPGGGCSPAMRRYFDPDYYRVVLFDQRGCGRSRPLAEVGNNTSWHLVRDTERICTDLGIGRYIGFGGSWGATLALICAISHPERLRHLVLRGVFLMTRAELRWFYGGGAGAFFPDLWQRFVAPIPEEERDDLIAAYHRRLFSGDRAEEIHFGRLWAGWENALASIQSDGWFGESPAEYARAFSRLENHYFSNAGFLDEDGWILKNRARIEQIPADIIQGRYDMICPPQSAWSLASGWERARLNIVPMAGHALSEPGISEALVRVMDRLRG